MVGGEGSFRRGQEAAEGGPRVGLLEAGGLEQELGWALAASEMPHSFVIFHKNATFFHHFPCFSRAPKQHCFLQNNLN